MRERAITDAIQRKGIKSRRKETDALTALTARGENNNR